LLELGYVDVDTLARALSGQHGVPAVLAQHVEAIDSKAVALFPAAFAIEHQAVPLGFTSTTPARLVVALRDPKTAPIEELAFAAGMRIEVGVAPERVVRACLAKYYDLDADKKYVELDLALHALPLPSSAPPAPRPPAEPLTLSAPPPPLPEAAPVVVTDATPNDDDWQPVVTPVGPLTAPPGALTPVLDVDTAVAALEAATSRDEVGDTLSAWLQSAWGFGIVLVVKDQLGMAVGWRGYTPDVETDVIASIAMPLGPASMLTSAYDGRVSFRGPPAANGAAIHRKLWSALGCEDPIEVLVIPIIVGDRVVNILYSHVLPGNALGETALEDAARVAAAASTAYARLIRRAK
jgi:hypothetical protein